MSKAQKHRSGLKSDQGPILVAIRTPDRSARAVLRKAAALARLYDAPLRMVHVLAIPQGALARAGTKVRRAAQADRDTRAQKLEKLASRAELRELEVSTTVRCDYPVQDALIREAMECRARLLVVATRGQGGRLARLFLSNIDWDLIRNCPCPLWLSKSAAFNARAPVLAAVDPLHSHAKPSMLDDIIVEHAVEAAGGKSDKVVLCHAFELPQGVPVGGPVEAYWIAMSLEEQRAHVENLKQALAGLRQRAGIPEKNVLLVRGNAISQLPKVASNQGASVVVMGAVSRRGLQRIFIGNTAERVIDRLDCDVLVVKPRGFKSPVNRRAYRERVARR